MELVFASNNTGKIKEIQMLLPQNIKILSLLDIGCTEDIPETADSLEGNAILKADYVTQNYGLPCFADDSGLEVESLNGAPGVHSARYAGEPKNDDNNIDKLLFELTNKENRKARFKTVIALNLNNKQELFSGTVHGNIIHEKRGTNGFGYDPVFSPEGYNQTFAEMSIDAKSKISHRANAVKQLVKRLLTENELKS